MTPYEKAHPLEALAILIPQLKGGHDELVTIRRLMLRATGLMPLDGPARQDIEAFLHEAALVSLELELTSGIDVSDGRVRLQSLLEPIASAAGAARSKL